MELIQTIPSDVARKLGYYVYAYVNPLDNRIFYVGKGKGQRVFSHLTARTEAKKTQVLREIRAAGKQSRLDILAHRLPTSEAALQVEAAVIDALRLSSLSNEIRGWRSSRFGRVPLHQLIAQYRRRPVRIKERGVLIRITDLYRPQMAPHELYDATRASWKFGPKRNLANYAFAVFEGIVREVYEVRQWLPAGSTFNSRDPRGVRSPDRWEFVGRVASETLRRRYIDRDVSSYFKPGARNPVVYTFR